MACFIGARASAVTDRSVGNRPTAIATQQWADVIRLTSGSSRRR